MQHLIAAPTAMARSLACNRPSVKHYRGSRRCSGPGATSCSASASVVNGMYDAWASSKRTSSQLAALCQDTPHQALICELERGAAGGCHRSLRFQACCSRSSVLRLADRGKGDLNRDVGKQSVTATTAVRKAAVQCRPRQGFGSDGQPCWLTQQFKTAYATAARVHKLESEWLHTCLRTAAGGAYLIAQPACRLDRYREGSQIACAHASSPAPPMQTSACDLLQCFSRYRRRYIC